MEILLVGPEKARVQAARIDTRYLGHLRAVVREDADARRAGTGVRQIDDFDMRERTFRSSLGAHVLNQFGVVRPNQTYYSARFGSAPTGISKLILGGESLRAEVR